MRERLGSRLGFILLSAGCAIGLGNVWRFPYIAGQNGGGWFVVLYLFFLAILGLPLLVMEFATGRAAQSSVIRLHSQIVPEKKAWRLHGLMGFCGSLGLMMFYTTVTGWMLLYFLKMAGGVFTGLTPDGVGAVFSSMLGDPWQQAGAMLVVCLSAAFVCSIGLQRGLERSSKVMMSLLLVLVIVLAINSIWLDARDGQPTGLSFYLIPDFARMRSVGLVKVIVEAMNHAFFTLSLGVGSMAIFGSYIGRERALLGEALHVSVLDTAVALCAGVIIIPACFAFGVEPGQGPGLVFVTLPNVFNNMAGGRLWGTLFFLFMSNAALTTVFAVSESLIACLMDFFGWSRRKASWIYGLVLPVLSLPCLLGFNLLSGFHPFGGSSGILDLEDFFVSTLMLPLGGLLFALFCCHRFGWGWSSFIKEANEGVGRRFSPALRVYCAYFLPIIILAVFVVGLINFFAPNAF